jgi:hypothetical protein
MPFEVRGDAPLDVIVKVRLAGAEKQRLREDAELAGLTMSEFLRRRAFGRPVIAAADRVAINELRRIGGLLKHVHVTSNGAYSKETADILAELKAFLRSLVAGGGA